MIEELQFRRGTAAEWTSANPVLAAGEPGFETDTLKLKIGDGTTHWTSLAYQGVGGVAGVTSVDSHTGVVTAAQLAASVTPLISPASIGAAALASPALTGSPTAPTQTAGDNSTKVATTAFVAAAVAAAISALTIDSLNGLAVVPFGSAPGTSRSAIAGGRRLWDGNSGVTPTNTVNGDIVLNAT
jgi:hypothetical protein